MKIVAKEFYNGAKERIERLGIIMFEEVIKLLEETELFLLEEKDSNSGAVVRERIDAALQQAEGWTKVQSGDVDWRKSRKINGSEVAIGVEVQVSARSDLVVIDIMHLRDALEKGAIDVGVIIVPSDKTAYFLTDRCPTLRETTGAIERLRSQHLPLVVLAVEHDGPGAMLPKKKKAKK
jgi:hypothetical protein